MRLTLAELHATLEAIEWRLIMGKMDPNNAEHARRRPQLASAERKVLRAINAREASAAKRTIARRLTAIAEAQPEPARDTGRYESGYRVFRDGSYREDFGSDR